MGADLGVSCREEIHETQLRNQVWTQMITSEHDKII